MATMLNFWVDDSHCRTIYFSRIRAAHNVAAENETIAMLCNIAGIDRDSFDSIELIQSVFGVSSWRSNMQPNQAYIYYHHVKGKVYICYWQITETTSNELKPTIY